MNVDQRHAYRASEYQSDAMPVSPCQQGCGHKVVTQEGWEN
jgi:hypothetical protein